MIEMISDPHHSAREHCGGSVQGIVAGMEEQAKKLLDTNWSLIHDQELTAVLATLEALSRRLEAITAKATAEKLGRFEAAGISTGSAATRIASALGVPSSAVRCRAQAGSRAGTPAMRAHREGLITSSQERAIADCVAELPKDCPELTHADLGNLLVEQAKQGASARAIRSTGARKLAILDPSRLVRLEALQQQRRDLNLGAVTTEGLSSVGITCEPRLRALLDAALTKFGAPGLCIGASAPTPGESLLSLGAAGRECDQPSRDEAAAHDTRTFGQRAYDALCHVLALGLQSDPATAKGVATIVVRVTPEQMDALQAAQCAGIAQDQSDHAGFVAATNCSSFQQLGAHGGLVTTSAGTEMSARQALSLAGGRSWFCSTLRGGQEELHRIDIDSGHGRRIASALQRLVLYAAHGGCTFPGCEKPAAICQAHHVIDYSHGGPTTIDNLALACPIHHGWVGHEPTQWRTEPDTRTPGLPQWIPPATLALVTPWKRNPWHVNSSQLQDGVNAL